MRRPRSRPPSSSAYLAPDTAGAPAAEAAGPTRSASPGYVGGEATASVAAETAPPPRAPMGGAADSAPAPSAAPSSAAPSSATPPSATGGATVRTTTTTTVTVEVDTPSLEEVAPEPEPEPYEPQVQATQRLLTAASVGDHDRRVNYRDFLQRHPYEARRLGLDMSRRVRFRVVDAQGQPVHDARVTVAGVEGRTHADGVWDWYPGVSGSQSRGAATVTVEALGHRGTARVQVPSQGDGQDVVLQLAGAHARRPAVLDLAFLIDVTGSMEDELRYVNQEVTDIVARVRSEVGQEARIRVGAVFYRDRTDSTPLQRIGFTEDIAGFARAMRSVRASGGGDYPEDLNAGLQTAFQGMAWSEGPAARVLVTIADAPPKRYGTSFDYHRAMNEAARRGIRILPVAASGADREVEFLFRAMGAMTSTPYVYLTDDSGIGNPHLEADTDRVAVEYFNDLLTRLLVSDMQGQGMHEPAGFGPTS